ncbi:MAG: hypothetical protein DNFNHJIP_00212 [Candidatus Argoarchaeum ethanivorans]|uniref:Uncharacterized protein n=1 Tax=Candidatus Argoarchaeum ethanivorans TaxID=2608793 RepID=A0A812A1C2_9EURY|nr:MAG: hypothetical protein DNFNHJIP_00212 [Candidatus Argoarchaeum ethanivorans]
MIVLIAAAVCMASAEVSAADEMNATFEGSYNTAVNNNHKITRGI